MEPPRTSASRADLRELSVLGIDAAVRDAGVQGVNLYGDEVGWSMSVFCPRPTSLHISLKLAPRCNSCPSTLHNNRQV
jgi:hypothetical protein